MWRHLQQQRKTGPKVNANAKELHDIRVLHFVQQAKLAPQGYELSLALCSMSQYSWCCADRRAGRVVPRVEREARGARLSVNPAAHARRQGCSTGDCSGIVATRSPLLQLCFADQKRPSFAF